MKVLLLLVAWCALAAWLGHLGRRIGTGRACGIGAATALGIVAVDFFAFGPSDPWRELSHGGPGPLPVRLLAVFLPKLIGLATVAAPAMAIARSRWWAARPRLRRAVAVAALVAAAAALLPTVREVRTLAGETVVIAGPTQALVLVSSMDLGRTGSPAAWIGLYVLPFVSPWAGAYSTRHRQDRFAVVTIEQDVARRLDIPGYGRFRGIDRGAVLVMASGRLSRWSGAGFIPLSEMESRAFHAIENGGAVPEGWTVLRFPPGDGSAERTFTAGGIGYRLQRRIDGKRRTLVLDSPRGTQAVWSMDASPRTVGGGEYARIFGDPPRPVDD